MKRIVVLAAIVFLTGCPSRSQPDSGFGGGFFAGGGFGGSGGFGGGGSSATGGGSSSGGGS
jgi:hypothetical protein